MRACVRERASLGCDSLVTIAAFASRPRTAIPADDSSDEDVPITKKAKK